MQQSQRASGNHALEYAVRRANAAGLPVRVGFGLTDGDPEATWRHDRFMLEGLAETAAALRQRGIPFVLRQGAPPAVAPAAVASSRAEIGARTLRPRIGRRLDEFLVPLEATPLAHPGAEAAARGLALDDLDALLSKLSIDRSVPPVSHRFRGVFGTVRSMTAGGLERKSDIQAYVEAVDQQVAEAQRAGVRFDDG